MHYSVNAIIGAVKTTVTLTVAYPKGSLGLDHPSPRPVIQINPEAHTLPCLIFKTLFT